MMELTTWNPFRDLEEFSNRLASTLSGKRDDQKTGHLVRDLWSPLVDITETKKEYIIKVELPEVDKSDIKVTNEGGTLTITGERKMEKEIKDVTVHRVERCYGHFLRKFTLPDDADKSKVTAEFKNGMLNVHLPKVADAQPKEIEVKVT